MTGMRIENNYEGSCVFIGMLVISILMSTREYAVTCYSETSGSLLDDVRERMLDYVCERTLDDVRKRTLDYV